MTLTKRLSQEWPKNLTSPEDLVTTAGAPAGRVHARASARSLGAACRRGDVPVMGGSRAGTPRSGDHDGSYTSLILEPSHTRVCIIADRRPVGAHRPQGIESDVEQDADLLVALAGVPDPRKERGCRHRLVTVLAVGVCGAGRRPLVSRSPSGPTICRCRSGCGWGSGGGRRVSPRSVGSCRRLISTRWMPRCPGGWSTRTHPPPGGCGWLRWTENRPRRPHR